MAPASEFWKGPCEAASLMPTCATIPRPQWTWLWVILQCTEHVNMFNDIHWYSSPSASSKPSPTTPALLLQSQIASQRLEELSSVWANHNLTHLFSDLTSWREFSLFFPSLVKCACMTWRSPVFVLERDRSAHHQQMGWNLKGEKWLDENHTTCLCHCLSQKEMTEGRTSCLSNIYERQRQEAYREIKASQRRQNKDFQTLLCLFFELDLITATNHFYELIFYLVLYWIQCLVNTNS